MTKLRRRTAVLAALTAVLCALTLIGSPARAARPEFSRAAMTALERDMLPDALGKVTRAGEYLGVPVSPGDILLPPESPDDPTNLTKAQLEQLGQAAAWRMFGTTTGGLGDFLRGLFTIGTAEAACGDTVVLHGSATDVRMEQIYDYRRLGAIGEDTCDKIQAYYRQRLVDARDESTVNTYHDVDQISLRHEDWDTGGDGCGYVDDTGYYQPPGVGPCFGTIDPDDVRGSEGDSPVGYYIRGGAFHSKGAQDRWQTYGQNDTIWYPLYDSWAASAGVRLSHCSHMWRALSSITYSRMSVPSHCDTWFV